MYALVFSLQLRPELRDIRRAHAFVLARLAAALRARLPAVACAGTSDLVLEAAEDAVDAAGKAGGSRPDRGLRAARKFSGNSLRIKRTHLLYHGTLLYGFDLSLVAACLQMPRRQPDYRASRSHANFLLNLPLSRQDLTAILHQAWPTEKEAREWPRDRLNRLVAERFARDEWNLNFG
jgi:lipoate-protein ligase A